MELFTTMTEDGWGQETRQNRIELQRRFGDIMGSLSPQEPAPGTRDYNVSHRHADGIFQFGRPVLKNMPGADAPPALGSRGHAESSKVDRHAGSLAHRLLGGARSSKRVVPANADTSRPAKSAARNEYRHSMSTGCFSPKKSDVSTRGSLSSFMMDSHNDASAKDTDDANTTTGASRRASS